MFLGIALLAVAACGGSSDDEPPTPLVTEPPTSISVPTSIPTTTPRPTSTRVPTAVPTATQTPPANPPVGELFIFMVEAEPGIHRVVLYDLAVRDEWASFGIKARRPDVLIAGTELLVRVGSTIDRTTLDGRLIRRIFESREGYIVRDVSLSPGGQVLAVSLLPKSRDDPGLLVFLDAATGGTRFDLEGASGNPDSPIFRPGSHRWRADSKQLAITSADSAHGEGLTSIVGLDGSVRSLSWRFLVLSPDFHSGAVLSPAADAPCLGAWSGLMIRDIETQAVLASIAVGADRLLGGITWAPDSSSVLYTELPRPPPGGTCADIDLSDETHYFLAVASGELRLVVDIEMLREEWRLTPRAHVLNGAPGAEDSVILDGVEIARGAGVRIIGFVELD